MYSSDDLNGREMVKSTRVSNLVQPEDWRKEVNLRKFLDVQESSHLALVWYVEYCDRFSRACSVI